MSLANLFPTPHNGPTITTRDARYIKLQISRRISD